ncbi:hypothetical protein EMPS_02088 [Entomortierella parvispora]|uniref:Uncharacterized protein n=1 Tax=Entomortierella parvispora TaxID=205924 RepID=A0A9P3H4B0_9FUNG|nr:hypothetical protein EMPS_02088 [Entomortierella parvispora]
MGGLWVQPLNTQSSEVVGEVLQRWADQPHRKSGLEMTCNDTCNSLIERASMESTGNDRHSTEGLQEAAIDDNEGRP